MKRSIGTLLGVLLAGTTLMAKASLDERPYVHLSGGYVFDDSARGTDDGETFRAMVGKRFRGDWGVEFGGFASQYRGDTVDWRDYGAMGDFLYYFADKGAAMQPFLLGGFGVMLSRDLNSGDESSDVVGNVGVGSTYFSTLGGIDIGVRGDYRWRVVDVEEAENGDTFSEHVVSLGLVIPFGAKKVAVVPPPPAPAPAAPKDSDGDGVTDDRDSCPNTPPGVKVDARGCPLDTDGDGVPDYLDKCPDTPKGLKVDANGCVTQTAQTIVLQNVNFEFNKDVLTSNAKSVLMGVAKGLNSQKDLRVEIAGHTDSVGTDRYNLDLSNRRAASVRTFLVSSGVGAAQLSSRGYGEAQPTASNDTDEGRAQNRRVEFRVLAK